MDPITPLHQDPNHVRNLDKTLNSSDATQTSPTDVVLPQPSPNHLILAFTNRFLKAIQRNDVPDIEDINQLYNNIMKSNLDLLTCDRSALCATRRTAMDLLNSHTTMSTPLDTPETPHQEPQKTCTMNSPKSVDLRQPPADHPIQLLTSAFQNAIQMNDVIELEAFNHLYCNNLKTNFDFSIYDCHKLHEIQQTAMNILKSRLQPPDNNNDWYMNKALQSAIQRNDAYMIEYMDRLFILNLRSNSDCYLYSSPNLHKPRPTASPIVNHNF